MAFGLVKQAAAVQTDRQLLLQHLPAAPGRAGVVCSSSSSRGDLCLARTQLSSRRVGALRAGIRGDVKPEELLATTSFHCLLT